VLQNVNELLSYSPLNYSFFPASPSPLILSKPSSVSLRGGKGNNLFLSSKTFLKFFILLPKLTSISLSPKIPLFITYTSLPMNFASKAGAKVVAFSFPTNFLSNFLVKKLTFFTTNCNSISKQHKRNLCYDN
jgi:hypothetical protein